MNRTTSNSRSFSLALRDTLSQLFIPEQDSKLIYLFLGLITLAGVILRLLVINEPIGYDEAYTFIYFAAKPLKFVLADYHVPNNHILYSLLTWIAYRVLGDHTWIVRVPAFIASAITVPVSFLTARRFFTANQSLAISAVLAVYPNMVNDASNGRGYSLILLFSLLLANFAGILVHRESRSALVAYAVTGALGFYSIPIFLYPMAGISLWVLLTYLINGETWQIKWKKIGEFLITCIASGILTLILYSPVILFGTGLKSLIGNDIVRSLTWNDFMTEIPSRISKTWKDWGKHSSLFIKQALAGGFLLSILFYRKASNQKLPMQILLLLAAVIALAVQRVSPLPRVWGYLEMFYVIFSVAGLIWFVTFIFSTFISTQNFDKFVTPIILLTTLLFSANTILVSQSPETIADRTDSPEMYIAEYLSANLTENDTIIATAPTDIETAYYLKVFGISYDFFYQRNRPVEIKNAIVLVRTNEKFNTLQKVLDAFDLTHQLDISSANNIYEYGPIQVYSIPAK